MRPRRLDDRDGASLSQFRVLRVRLPQAFDPKRTSGSQGCLRCEKDLVSVQERGIWFCLKFAGPCSAPMVRWREVATPAIAAIGSARGAASRVDEPSERR